MSIYIYTHTHNLLKHKNTLKFYYLYSLNSSNIYKYWVTTVHAEVRKVHSGRVTDTQAIFISNMHFDTFSQC